MRSWIADRGLIAIAGFASTARIVQVTARRLFRSDRVLGRRRGRAGREAIRASRIEGAAGRQGAEHRDRAVDGVQPLAGRASRNRREQPARVRMLRRAQNLPNRARFDDPPGVHDGDAIRRLRDDAEVVRDEQQRQAERPLHFAQQVEDFGLDRDVERRRRLVGDDERRLAGEGDRDHHALPHAARQLVRIVVHAPAGIRDADRGEKVDRARAGGPAARRTAVDEQRLRDLVADAEDGIERRHRLLEDQRDLRAADRAHRSFVEREEVASPEEHPSTGVASRRLDEPHDRERRHRLAAAGFSDEAERFSLPDLEADVVDCRHGAARRCQKRSTRFDVRPGEVLGSGFKVPLVPGFVPGSGSGSGSGSRFRFRFRFRPTMSR